MSEYSQIMYAREYLINNVLLPLYPSIEPLPTLIGVCTQVDNVSTEIPRLRAQVAVLLRVKEAAMVIHLATGGYVEQLEKALIAYSEWEKTNANK